MALAVCFMPTLAYSARRVSLDARRASSSSRRRSSARRACIFSCRSGTSCESASAKAARHASPSLAELALEDENTSPRLDGEAFGDLVRRRRASGEEDAVRVVHLLHSAARIQRDPVFVDRAVQDQLRAPPFDRCLCAILAHREL
eukprot:CAMPEP_0180324060 /NCGR_PEP_ID=MMETSP0988-20121125/37647_1 /TAXON_ID=697907 /ORGANISM="non described non described, Strain CCMP2293" /LENGTH=144 /DNA_ID=CAMNT_0022310313 /DNA_START=183 /DNA_END=616 /DNA_ORIENTATION=-